MTDQPSIWCCACGTHVLAERVSGTTVYPHRPDLAKKRFWSCPECRHYVGAHRDTMKPLGTIPTPQIRTRRAQLHSELDPLWKHYGLNRKQLYARLAKMLGIEEFHIGEVNSDEEADRVSACIDLIEEELSEKQEAHRKATRTPSVVGLRPLIPAAACDTVSPESGQEFWCLDQAGIPKRTSPENATFHYVLRTDHHNSSSTKVETRFRPTPTMSPEGTRLHWRTTIITPVDTEYVDHPGTSEDALRQHERIFQRVREKATRK